MVDRQPDWVLVYGDTNSTLAAALAATKLNIPVAHVEAGLRSYNKQMPEETNRVVTDHVSKLLFCPTKTAVMNLRNEGILGKGAANTGSVNPSVVHIGDVMYDAALAFKKVAKKKSSILDNICRKYRRRIIPQEFALVTFHRQENTDNICHLKEIAMAIDKLSSEMQVVFPVHPRTENQLRKLNHPTAEKILNSLNNDPRCNSTNIENLFAIKPVSFLDMVMLEINTKLILTDSGGVQKEAYFHKVPCITLREETEWVETVQAGWNTLTGADVKKIISAARNAKKGDRIDQYGDGFASECIVEVLISNSKFD
jgi:UDP-GlcNAc3NAcA epimerase